MIWFWSLILASNAGGNPKLSLVQIWYWQKLLSRPSIFIIWREYYKMFWVAEVLSALQRFCEKLLFFFTQCCNSSLLGLQQYLPPTITTNHNSSTSSPPISHHLGVGMAHAHFFSCIERSCLTPTPSASSFQFLGGAWMHSLPKWGNHRHQRCSVQYPSLHPEKPPDW